MSPTKDMHKLARRWFRQKVRLGELPLQVTDGDMRGLIFYPVVFGDTEQWLTVIGLADPIHGADVDDRTWVAQVGQDRLLQMQEADERERVSRRRRHTARARQRTRRMDID